MGGISGVVNCQAAPGRVALGQRLVTRVEFGDRGFDHEVRTDRVLLGEEGVHGLAKDPTSHEHHRSCTARQHGGKPDLSAFYQRPDCGKPNRHL